MKRHTLYVGLCDKDMKKQIVNSLKAKQIVNSVVGDCSIQDIMGYYTHDNGMRVQENTLKVECLFKDDRDILGYCNDLKRLLNQESIAVVTDEINSVLV